MAFKIVKSSKINKARIGILKTAHGEVETPVFLPIATKASVKGLSSEEVSNLGVQMILGNTYHLNLQPGAELIKKLGGLHKFMNWSGPVFTDSGGYQVFSLGEKMTNNLREPFNREISEQGVNFQSGIDGAKIELSPEKSVEIQHNLGSDIAVVLDEFTGEINNKEKVAATVNRTTRWAKRSRKYFLHNLNESTNPGQIQLGVVQGGMFKDLREQSAHEIKVIGFDGYAIGGVAVGGETSQEQYKAVAMTEPYLENDKFKHLFGVGTPEQIVKNVSLGMDSFDCVIPTREGRHGRAYVVVDQHGYKVLNVSSSDWRADSSPIDAHCTCISCISYSRAYLHHLFKAGELLGMRAMTVHNLHFYLNLMHRIRQAISEDRFEDLLNFKQI